MCGDNFCTSQSQVDERLQHSRQWFTPLLWFFRGAKTLSVTAFRVTKKTSKQIWRPRAVEIPRYACMLCLRCSVPEGHKAVAYRVAACESFKEQAIYWLGITNGKNVWISLLWICYSAIIIELWWEFYLLKWMTAWLLPSWASPISVYVCWTRAAESKLTQAHSLSFVTQEVWTKVVKKDFCMSPSVMNRRDAWVAVEPTAGCQCQKKANMVQMTVPWAARAKLNGEPAYFSFKLSESLKES